jgi:hypothetical protein
MRLDDYGMSKEAAERMMVRPLVKNMVVSYLSTMESVREEVFHCLVLGLWEIK